MQSALNGITISQVKLEEQSNTESFCLLLKPEVDAVSDKKINNFSVGKLGHMNNFKEHVFPKTTLALSITASIINSPRTFPIHSLNRTKEVNFISIIKLRFDVPHQEFAGRQY